MKATILDLRYKMKEVLNALERNEPVTILYHGKEKGVINSVAGSKSQSVKDHPFFGMDKNKNGEDPSVILSNLRKSRYEDL